MPIDATMSPAPPYNAGDDGLRTASKTRATPMARSKVANVTPAPTTVATIAVTGKRSACERPPTSLTIRAKFYDRLLIAHRYQYGSPRQ